MERIYPPTKYIKDLLEEKNWNQTDLAFLLGWTSSDVSNLLLRKKKITPEVARDLAKVFNTPPFYWIELEAKYELSQLDDADDSLALRSKIFNNFPAKEMIKRGWVEPTDDVHELQNRFLNFFEISSLDEKPNLNYAALKSTSYFETTNEQAGWIKKAFQLAPAVLVRKFSDKVLSETMDKLRLLLFNAEDIRHIPKVLAEAGIRLLIIEPLPSSKIDGVTFWVDKNSPVIVLSLRFDRIDSFWHTLLHELSHIKNGEGKDTPIIDVDLLGENSPTLEKPNFEKRADADAAEFSIPKSTLDSFVMRTHPTYTEPKILGFSALNKVHAGILVGQLHHRYRTTGKGLPFSYQRKFLVKIRHIITDSALTDGYGYRTLV